MNVELESAIEQIFPFIQNTLGKQGSGFTTKLDLTSSGRHRSSEIENARNIWGDCLRTDVILSNRNHHTGEDSFDCQNNDNDYDMKEDTGLFCIALMVHRFKNCLNFFTLE